MPQTIWFTGYHMGVSFFENETVNNCDGTSRCPSSYHRSSPIRQVNSIMNVKAAITTSPNLFCTLSQLNDLSAIYDIPQHKNTCWMTFKIVYATWGNHENALHVTTRSLPHSRNQDLLSPQALSPPHQRHPSKRLTITIGCTTVTRLSSKYLRSPTHREINITTPQPPLHPSSPPASTNPMSKSPLDTTPLSSLLFLIVLQRTSQQRSRFHHPRTLRTGSM